MNYPVKKIIVDKYKLGSLCLKVAKLGQSGVRQVKLVLPFKLEKNDSAPSVTRAAPEIAEVKKYARSAGIKISSGYSLANNPYLPEDRDFLNIDKAELKIDLQKFKSKPKFTVVIPVYNKKNSLKFALSGFFNQNFAKSKYEVIVVDDGSEDSAPEMVKNILPVCNFKYFYWPRKRIKVKQKQKRWSKFYNRAGPARNIGIKHAQGDIVLFNDADVLVDRNCLEKHKKYHDQRDNLVIRGFRNYLSENFKPNYKNTRNLRSLTRISCPERVKWEKPENFRDEKHLSDKWFRFVTANLSIRRKYLEEVGGFDKDFVFWGFEDTDLGYRLGKKFNLGFIWDDRIKVYHLYHPREAGDKLNDLFAFKIGADIFYHKYLDEEIYNLYKDVIMGRLEDIILEDYL